MLLFELRVDAGLRAALLRDGVDAVKIALFAVRTSDGPVTLEVIGATIVTGDGSRAL